MAMMENPMAFVMTVDKNVQRLLKFCSQQLSHSLYKLRQKVVKENFKKPFNLDEVFGSLE